VHGIIKLPAQNNSQPYRNLIDQVMTDHTHPCKSKHLTYSLKEGEDTWLKALENSDLIQGNGLTSHSLITEILDLPERTGEGLHFWVAWDRSFNGKDRLLYASPSLNYSKSKSVPVFVPHSPKQKLQNRCAVGWI